jgi:hypothetical protein
MIGLGLRAIDEKNRARTDRRICPSSMHHAGEDGIAMDGRRADHYIAFAMHFYGLIYGRLGNDPERTNVFQRRAEAFVPEFVRWFAKNGAVLPFGRSMTYRFACGSFWSALAFADFPALPWGQIKGLVLRHLRWWSKQPIAHRDGVLSTATRTPICCVRAG